MKKYYALLLFVIILCINYSACKNKHSKEQKVNQYIGKKINLPKDSIFILKKDSLKPVKTFNSSKNKIKIVTRINGQCHICVLHLDQWKQEIMKKFKGYSVQFIYYLYTDNFELFKKKYYYRISGAYPLLIDTTNAFIRNNQLPKMDQRFHTFLLDRNNKAILVGNPLLNTKIRELYIEEINKRLD